MKTSIPNTIVSAGPLDGSVWQGEQPEPGGMLSLVAQLVDALNRSGAVYCHWKSNFTLAQALTSDLDLDLLVSRESLPQVLALLAELGFRQAVDGREPEEPGISHYYGFDPQTARLVHVHLFSQVLTGESFVKSHLLPLKPMLLGNISYAGSIRVASRPAELVLFILRTFIKYGSLLDLKYLAGNADEIKAELRWLRAGGEMAVSLELLERYCPAVDEALFLACVDALEADASLLTRVRLARQVRRRLRMYARAGTFGRLSAYGRLLWGKAWLRLRGRRRNRMLKSGGAVIAFVGPEATGKSTLVSESGRWLGKVFAARTVHAGKPPSSWLTAPFNALIPLARRALPRQRTTRLEGRKTQKDSAPGRPPVKGWPSLLYAFRAVALAWDRRRLLTKARRLATNGEIVICDRYPSDAVGAMDSPRLAGSPAGSGALAAIYRRLAGLEHKLYRQIPPPDTVIILQVSVETAIARNLVRVKKGKETAAYVASRHRQFREWHKAGTGRIQHLDTEQPLEETILNAKRMVWESL